ncbi:MAG: MBL fold metallo-hydrolase [Candidatus Methanomethylophilaceae archaeon]|mgnify:FL=1|jgi:phosphoribosyl 1,2-cyclic phosphodiesterase|nr:MBL fold metallo-hydrolase [Candidatus Methanomethylophilaceae archaeon]NCA73605.1 MBL fold metallo-hydrolase [Gammaproteobacteria bacterium]MDD2936490.1 MBL fold metallo-hydrolase [Candidatus Methanomethylophilaceae archaeon]MDD3351663.1 MBL fold metallo-hydrolase [Candidatus Methanomethylophilaceae archaeon]MDD3986859.1 MBL fold metallo-hydrolase [Candidatus Methanomethylophilaceae archaeon]
MGLFEAHVLASGSDGNCTVIESDGEAIMIDAGISCRRIMALMDQEGIDPSSVKAMLLTHEHSDHVSGAGATARKLDIPVYCNVPTFESCTLGQIDHRPISTGVPFELCGMRITPLPTSHNAADPNAFLTETDGTRILVATDTGKLTYQVEHALSLADLAIIESNYDSRMLTDGPYPPSLKRLIGSDIGHLSNVACANAIMRTRKEGRKIFLAHLSKTNNTPDTARDTVARIIGEKRFNIDCLEFPGDTRTIRARA